MPELTTGEVRELANVLSRLGCVQVSLGGGEPILREDLPEVVSTLQNTGIRTRVLTNGVALSRPVALRLLKAGLREISFSLDSLNAERQENLDGVSGTFTRRLDNLLSLAELLPHRNVLPLLNTVVTPGNLSELPRILDLAERIGFHSSFVPLHLANAGPDEHRFYGSDDSMRFGPENKDHLRSAFRELAEGKKAGRPIINSTSFLERCPDYLLRGKVAWPCRAGTLYLSVSPDGLISPCHAFEGKVGIPFREFEKLFRSRDYLAEVKALATTCEGCFRPCWAEISFLVLEPRSLWEMSRVQLFSGRKRPPVDREAVRRLIDRREETSA